MSKVELSHSQAREIVLFLVESTSHALASGDSVKAAKASKLAEAIQSAVVSPSVALEHQAKAEPKRLGRPPKATSHHAPKPRGRPRKSEPTLTAPLMEPRRRGRPRKSEAVSSPNATDKTRGQKFMDGEAVVIKRGRGRPPKVKVETIIAAKEGGNGVAGSADWVAASAG